MKVAIVGSGRIGSLVAFYLTVRDSIDEIVLIDKSKEKADTDAVDISYIPAMIGNTKLYSGGFESTADSDIVVIAAQADKNNIEDQISNVKEIVDNVMKFNQDLIFIIVSDPIDVITYVVSKATGLPREKVIGAGTFLDTIAYKSILAYKLGHNPVDVEAMIIGEHGENMLALKELINIHGISLNSFPDIDKGVIDESYTMVKENRTNDLRSSLQFSPAVAVANIIEAIVHDKRVLLPLCFMLNGEYGLKDVAISVPVIIGKNGIEEVVEIDLSEANKKQLELGAALLKTEITKYNKK